MFNLKKLLTMSMFLAGMLSHHNIAFPDAATNSAHKAKAIEQLTLDLKAISKTLSNEQVTNKFEEKIMNICSAIEKLRIKQFIAANQNTFDKLSTIGEEALNQCASSLRDIEVKMPEATYQPNSQKSVLIDEFFKLFKFDAIKRHFAFYIVQSAPCLNLNKEEVEQRITATIKRLMDEKLTEPEISNFINFCKGAAFQRMSQHAPEFIQIILDNLSPVIANQIKQCCCAPIF